MKLVLQGSHPTACQHACMAMLAGKTLEEVIRDVGHENRLDVKDREKLALLYGIKIDVWKSFPVSAFGVSDDSRLGYLMQKEKTLLCSVFDYRDINFAHNTIIHGGDLFDPHAGMNPIWPWSRVIGYASPVAGIE